MQPFLTGSQIYGVPTEDSDVDLVILMEDSIELHKLIQLSDNKEYPIRFGKLNIIPATSLEEMQKWKKALLECKTVKKLLGRSLTKEEALNIHAQIRGQRDAHESGPE